MEFLICVSSPLGLCVSQGDNGCQPCISDREQAKTKAGSVKDSRLLVKGKSETLGSRELAERTSATRKVQVRVKDDEEEIMLVVQPKE